MKTHLSDLIEKLQPEQPEEKKTFTGPKSEHLLSGLSAHLKEEIAQRALFNEIDQIDTIVQQYVATLPDTFAQTNPQELVDLAPDCYGAIHSDIDVATVTYSLFLSALMARRPTNNIHVRKPLRFFGLRFSTHFPETCNLVVQGTLGRYAFREMQDGIAVVARVGDYCAAEMRGGHLTIKHRAGKRLAESMHGGTIVAHGSVEGIGTSDRGNIHLFCDKRPEIYGNCFAHVYHNRTRIK
jgi:hypothetical protein